MTNFRKTKSKILECTFCKNRFKEKELYPVDILIGCADTVIKLLCKDCYERPIIPIRRRT